MKHKDKMTEESDTLYWSLSTAHKKAIDKGEKVFIDLDEDMVQSYGITRHSDSR